MESYIALKVKKAKTSRLSGRQRHNERIGKQGNVRIDPRKTPFNITLKKCEGTYQEAIEKIIEERYTGKRAIRKDAVKLVEFTLQFGGDYGADGSVGIVAKNEALKKGYEFIKERFGDENIISAIIHNDETNPHIHIDIVPMLPDGSLSAKRLIGPEELQKLQDEFLEQMQKAIPQAGFIRKPDDVLNGKEQEVYEKIMDKIEEERAKFKEHINNSRAHLNLMKNKFKKERSELNKKASESRAKFEKYQKEVKAELRELRQSYNRDYHKFKDEEKAFNIEKDDILKLEQKVTEEKERFDKEREAFDKMIASETANLDRDKKDLERRESSFANKLKDFDEKETDFKEKEEKFNKDNEQFIREKEEFKVIKYNILNKEEMIKNDEKRLDKRKAELDDREEGLDKRESNISYRERTYNSNMAQYRIDKYNILNGQKQLEKDQKEFENKKSNLMAEVEEQQQKAMEQVTKIHQNNQLWVVTERDKLNAEREALRQMTTRIDRALENVPTFNSNLIKWAESQPVERKENVERLVNMAYRQGVNEPIREIREQRETPQAVQRPLRRLERSTSLPRDEMDKMLDDILSGDIEDFGKAVDLLDEDKGFYL